jgi:uncharacterized protein YggL (DUF469 family)
MLQESKQSTSEIHGSRFDRFLELSEAQAELSFDNGAQIQPPLCLPARNSCAAKDRKTKKWRIL